MKKLFLLSALLIFACSSDDSSNDNDNNNNSGLLNCDGNPIPSIVYGSQEWTVENACHITYRDGTPIPQVTDNDEWANLTTGAWCYYDNDTSKHRLYNWYAVAGIHDNNDSTQNKEFAAEGWHVPSEDEWLTLENYLIANGYNYDGTTIESKIGKSIASNTGWNSSTVEGAPGNDQNLNNSSGFNAIPEGYGFDIGGFGLEGSNAIFWSSNEGGTEDALRCSLSTHNSYIIINYAYKESGFSVRLVKD